MTMDSRHITQVYAGPLSPEQAEAGMLAIKANAARLARDARLLFHAQRYPSAATMAAAALNEIARLPVLMELFAARRHNGRSELWRRFRRARHDFPWTVFAPGKPAADYAPLNDALAFINTMGATVDCLGPGNWFEPEQIVQSALAQELVGTAEMLCLGPASDGVVRLWIDTIRAEPANATPGRTLDRFRAALESGGFKSEAAVLDELRKNHRALG